MKRASAILSLIIGILIVPLSYLAWIFSGWSDGAANSHRYASDLFLVLVLPFYFFFLSALFFSTVTGEAQRKACWLGSIVYAPVIIIAACNHVSLLVIILLIFVPALIIAMGVLDGNERYNDRDED
jgi:hypothetical protein